MNAPKPEALLLIGDAELKAIAAWPHAFGGELSDSCEGVDYDGALWMRIAGIRPDTLHRELADRLIRTNMLGPDGTVPDLVRQYVQKQVRRKIE